MVLRRLVKLLKGGYLIMAITKMSLVKLNGNVTNIDDTMVKCCNFGMFHPERASLLEEYEKNNDSFLEYSKNTGYLRKIVDLAGKLGLGLFKDQISELKKFEDRLAQLQTAETGKRETGLLELMKDISL